MSRFALGPRDPQQPDVDWLLQPAARAAANTTNLDDLQAEYISLADKHDALIAQLQEMHERVVELEHHLSPRTEENDDN